MNTGERKKRERERLLRRLRAHKAELQRQYGLKRLALFGSWARGEQSRTSDVDIMVEFEGRIGWEIVDLHEELERLLGRRVDLLTKNALLSKPRLWHIVEKDLVDV